MPEAFRTRKALVIALALACGVGFYVYDLSQVRKSVHWQYFNQVITGNWSSVQPSKDNTTDGQYISDPEYLCGLIGAIIINFGPLLAIIGVALALLERRTEMDLLTAFAERDLNTEVSLVTSITQSAEELIAPGRHEEFLKAVHTAIDEAGKDWWGPNLDEKYGRERAEKIRAKMKELDLTA